MQRDLYSACLLAYLDPPNLIPSIAQHAWAGAESRLMAAVEFVAQRARNGQVLPRSFGLTGARARQPESLSPNRQELADFCEGNLSGALGLASEPPRL
ncbi:MAG: hypothetical protein ACRDHZ_22350 [Ktedonobacteraceae bacterium]